MNCSFRFFAWQIAIGAVFAAVAVPTFVHAEQREDRNDRDHRRPVYQRHAFDWKDRGGYGRHSRREVAPQVNSGWFQRPYPYHLDYYKMRYGGSYAPYFGNLYGPPQVVTAPPYYGPYYGGYEGGQPDGYGPNGGYGGYPNGAVYQAPVDQAAPTNQSALPPDSDELPAP